MAPKPVKKLIAVRGDDRPGQKKTEVAAPVRGGKPGMGRPDRGREGSGAMGARHFREDARPSLADRGPQRDSRRTAPVRDRAGVVPAKL